VVMYLCVRGYRARRVGGHVFVLGVIEESRRSCICVLGVIEESRRSCICVLGVIEPGE
jgi:hypothetical protein